MCACKAVFLDAGFTLLQMDPSWEGCFLQITRDCGVVFSAADLERAKKEGEAFFVERYHRPNDTWSDDGAILTFWTDYYRVILEALAFPVERVEHYAGVLAASMMLPRFWRPYPESQKVLTGLKDAGYVVGVLSDWNSDLPQILSATGLSRCIDFMLVSAIAGVAKPRPAFFRLALERAGVPAAQAIMVGDSLYADVQGAMQVGIQGVLLDRLGRWPDAGVPTIRQLDDLWMFLDGACLDGLG